MRWSHCRHSQTRYRTGTFDPRSSRTIDAKPGRCILGVVATFGRVFSDDDLGIHRRLRPSDRQFFWRICFWCLRQCKYGVKAVGIPLRRIDVGRDVDRPTPFFNAIERCLLCRGRCARVERRRQRPRRCGRRGDNCDGFP